MEIWEKSLRRIEKVPVLLREVEHNKDAYDPKVVSFGPYHHGKPELQLCEKAKELTLQMYLNGSGQSDDFFKREVSKILAYARICYVEGSTSGYSDDEFIDMMLLDASFLIYFMGIVDERNKLLFRCIFNNLGLLVYSMVNRDMFLLENQIPFQVLMLLINLRFGKKQGGEGVSRFLHRSIWGHYNEHESGAILQQQIKNLFHDKERAPLHLLEAFRTVLVWDFFQERQQESQDNANPKEYNKTLRSATDLKAKGIDFKPSGKRSLKCIKFESSPVCGKLELPVWCVSFLSKVFFLNMIAYEVCPNNCRVETTVLSYVAFMKSLIDKPSDVKVLREKRILLTNLGSDEDVVQLFRNFDTSGIDDTCSFMEAKQRIQKHYDSKTLTWRAELIHAYLSSPWSIIAWFAGFLILIMTFLQTYFTIAK